MTWRPLIREPALRTHILQVARELVAHVETARPNGMDARCDRLLVYGYLDELVNGLEVPVDTNAALASALTAFEFNDGNTALFGGVTRFGWTMAHLAEGDGADRLCESLDAKLIGLLSGVWSESYDLISGLVGIGVYALERGAGGRALAVRVLEHLAALAQQRRGGFAWHTDSRFLPAWQRAVAPRGYWNLGIAHGSAGVVALCARYVVEGVETKLALEVLRGAMAHLLAAGPHYASWDVDGHDVQPSTRLAWCYNDLGIAASLLRAALVDSQWLLSAVALARDCALRSFEAAKVENAALCHGAAGVAHIFNRMFQATGDGVLGAAAERWVDFTISSLHQPSPFERSPSRGASSGINSSLLTGATGVALLLHSTVSEAEPLWDRLLLIDISTRP